MVLVTSARSYSTADIFAAGFQDHAIGTVLGIDPHTGAGGANVWDHSFLRWLFVGPDGEILPDAPFKPLPKGANLSVAVRRALRVGPKAGMELEDFGVVPDQLHHMTRVDILKQNADLINQAGDLLAAVPRFNLTAVIRVSSDGGLLVAVQYTNLDRVDFYLDERPVGSEFFSAMEGRVEKSIIDKGSTLALRGYQFGTLVASRRIIVARPGL